jgi:hypothetical protein
MITKISILKALFKILTFENHRKNYKKYNIK